MEPSNLFLFLLLITSGYTCTASVGDRSSRPTKLFVFGDSYADTGNVRKSLARSWNEPYGITFPGKPAGRFSDGRVLTDYFARFLGLKTPIAYAWRRLGGKKVHHGMNFAYGGSGVFDTYGAVLPNMSTQIDFFEELINQSLYNRRDLKCSVVLIALSGNDYAAYLTRGGSSQGLQSFISVVVNQLALNLRRIRDTGAAKITVNALQPIGCLPQITRVSSYQLCNTTQNLAVNYHNMLLQQAVDKLNNETNGGTIFVLDLYNSFTTVLNQKRDTQGTLKFERPLTPCCMGINSEFSCGSVDDKGGKMYSVCSDPKSVFFWDSLHPTQAGWNAVFTALGSSLGQFFKFD